MRVREVYLHSFGRKPEVEICRKWICVICLIDMLGAKLGSMLEMVQKAETAHLTLYQTYTQGF